MPAWSFDKGSDTKRTFVFESLAFVGLGRDVEGRLIRSNLEISREGNDHEFVRQFWVQADGTGRAWLAVDNDTGVDASAFVATRARSSRDQVNATA